MSLQIDSIDDLKVVLKACKLNIANIDDLQGLLRTINSTYNPDAARVRIAKTLGTTVPTVAFLCAAGVSFVLFTSTIAGLTGQYMLGALGVIWGVAGLASVIGTIFSSLIFFRRPGRTAPTELGNGLAAHAFPARSENIALPEGRG